MDKYINENETLLNIVNNWKYRKEHIFSKQWNELLKDSDELLNKQSEDRVVTRTL